MAELSSRRGCLAIQAAPLHAVRRTFAAALLSLALCAGHAQSRAQTPARPWRIATASSLGCPIDGRTDATACINNFLAAATAANPLKLVLDGTVAMRGLVLSPAGNTWIAGLGWGTGIVIAPGSNQDGIRIGPYTGGFTEGQHATLPARTAANIILSDFTIDAGGPANGTGPSLGLTPDNQPAPGNPSHPIFEVILTNATGILIDHVRFLNPPRYCLTFANVADVTVRDSSFTSPSILQDGVHVDGPAENIRVLNNVFATGDDAIALNAPEGYGGDIADVLVDGNTFDRAWTVARIYTSLKAIAGDTHTARRIAFSHNRGATRNVAFNLGMEGGAYTAAADQIDDVSIDNNDISSPGGFAMMRTPFGSVRLTGNVYTPTTPTPMVQVLAPGGGDLALTDNTILRNRDAPAAAPLVLLASGSTLARLTLAGNRIVDAAAADLAPVPYLLDIAGALAALRIDSAPLTGAAALLNPATGVKGIASVSGPGVLATDTPIPDAMMTDGSAYISSTGANAGKVCVKIDGKVMPL